MIAPTESPSLREAPPPRRARGAFSLAELVMALAILLVLIPSVIPIYDAFLSDSKEESLRTRLASMRRAIVTFQLENGRYPYQLFDHFGNNVDILDDQVSELTQGPHDGFASYPPGRRIYLERIPVDPFTKKADWELIGVDNDGDGAFNEDPIDITTSTHRSVAVTRALGEKILAPLGYAVFDNDLDGRVDEDPIDVMDVRSRDPRYASY